MRAWSKHDDATIKACADQGLSAADCARLLPGAVTRNMVIGRAYRIGVHFNCSHERMSEKAMASVRRRWLQKRAALA